MSDPADILEAGSILVIEGGVYSDHWTHGPLRMLRTGTKSEIVAMFESDFRLHNPDEDDHIPERDFPSFLIRCGWAEAVDYNSWHIGDYEFNPFHSR